jgi:hypothetical protein
MTVILPGLRRDPDFAVAPHDCSALQQMSSARIGQMRRIPSQAPYGLAGGRATAVVRMRAPAFAQGRRPAEVAEFMELGHLGWAAAI